MTTLNFETISFQLDHHIATVRLNRPGKANAMNAAMLNSTPKARVAVLQGDRKQFCAGIDLQMMAAIHGACVGGGIDLITCADMRYASADAFFTIKEIDLGMTADVGTLQRLPQMVGEGMARELAYTGRTRSMPKRPDRSV